MPADPPSIAIVALLALVPILIGWALASLRDKQKQARFFDPAIDRAEQALEQLARRAHGTCCRQASRSADCTTRPGSRFRIPGTSGSKAFTAAATTEAPCHSPPPEREAFDALSARSRHIQMESVTPATWLGTLPDVCALEIDAWVVAPRLSISGAPTEPKGIHSWSHDFDLATLDQLVDLAVALARTATPRNS